DPVVTVPTSRDPASVVAAPRGSVIAATDGLAGGAKHISEVCRRAFCLSTTIARPRGPAPQKLLRTPRRPVKAVGWTWTNGRAARVTPVRGLPSSGLARREGRPQEVFFRTLHDRKTPVHVPPSNQTERGRDLRRWGASRGRRPSKDMLRAAPRLRSS